MNSCNNQKFFKCRHCGNFVGMLFSSGAAMTCCGEVMAEVIPNTVDAAQEKHVPVIEVNGREVTVKVGSVMHPSLEEHHITWIYLQTCNGGQRKCVRIGEEPVAKFMLVDGDSATAAFEYCNLHGLWKAEVK